MYIPQIPKSPKSHHDSGHLKTHKLWEFLPRNYPLPPLVESTIVTSHRCFRPSRHDRRAPGHSALEGGIGWKNLNTQEGLMFASIIEKCDFMMFRLGYFGFIASFFGVYDLDVILQVYFIWYRPGCLPSKRKKSQQEFKYFGKEKWNHPNYCVFFQI